jgi:hypothetical protein
LRPAYLPDCISGWCSAAAGRLPEGCPGIRRNLGRTPYSGVRTQNSDLIRANKGTPIDQAPGRMPLTIGVFYLRDTNSRFAKVFLVVFLSTERVHVPGNQ